MNLNDIWLESLSDARMYLKEFYYSGPEVYSKLQKLSILAIETIKNGGKIFICGNGGSHADAMHFAEELTGRYRNDRKSLPAVALGSNPAHLTCVSNDFGFEEVFSREFEALAKPEDLLIVLSTSGNSENICKVITSANKKLLKSFALLGKDGGRIKNLINNYIIVPGKNSDRIQELHMLILHILVETIEAGVLSE